jgi:erythromycin esterase-like protein
LNLVRQLSEVTDSVRKAAVGTESSIRRSVATYNCLERKVYRVGRFLGLFGRGLAIAACVLASAVGAAQNLDQAATEWLRKNAIPIQTVEAGHGFADLKALDKVIGDARIVELGEATHGTREFFQLKHRLVEYLATQKGFTIFSIEANMPEAYRLNDYVLNGNGDPRELLKGMYFWTWNTQEVLDMILWMREFDRSGKGRIEFTGFDMQTPAVSIDIVRKFASAHDPEFFSKTLDPLYSVVERMAKKPESSFGVATASLPIEAAAGKHVTLSGYIKSEDVKEGWAGLWMRIDGEKGTPPLAFDNMQNRGATGTTPWTRYEISMDVPANATAVVFGALQTGSGTAWIDSLEIRINGKPYKDLNKFDPEFESATPRGFYTGGKGYDVSIDTTTAQSGKQSLRMKQVSVPEVDAATIERNIDLAARIQKCSDVAGYLASNRDHYVQAGVAGREIDWVVQNARLVLQYVQIKAGVKTRDESMADNVRWIADENPGARIVVWAHNSHISNGGYSETAAMGSYLRKVYGSQLVNFGFAFNEGSFRAVEPGKGLRDFTVEPADEGTLDQTLAKVGIPVFAIDLRRAPKEGPVAEWFNEPHPAKSIGAVYSDATAQNYWNVTATDDFDVLLFVEKTTAARPVQ